ncbi:MAG: tRNA (N(6)-L-threonylcarbamoyladenosine(37)-C(2))-methylthiotransferase MtaB [Chloroflexota bacterium]
MKVRFYNLGCKVNFAETSAMREEFSAVGYSEAAAEEQADVVVINTCTVTSRADADCRKVIRRARRENPDAYLAVMGCYAQLRADEIQEIDGVDGIFGAQDKFSILTSIRDFRRRPAPDLFVGADIARDFHGAASAESDSRARAVLKIQDGCDYKCSYCAIPAARGGSRSMPFEEILPAARKLREAGYREIILTGINLGEYDDGGKKFGDALAALAGADFDMRYRISSIEPNLITGNILRLAAESPRVCRHFHIPLQSGSNKILRLMRRRYNAEFFAEKIVKIKDACPDCAIGVDVITGFPGEGEPEFRETYELLAGLPVSYLHVFSYSERSGTPAASMPERVPPAERKRRTLELRALSKSKLEEFYRSQVGKRLWAVPERYEESSGLWTGHTDNYVDVRFPESADFREGLVELLLERVARGKGYGRTVN